MQRFGQFIIKSIHHDPSIMNVFKYSAFFFYFYLSLNLRTPLLGKLFTVFRYFVVCFCISSIQDVVLCQIILIQLRYIFICVIIYL